MMEIQKRMLENDLSERSREREMEFNALGSPQNRNNIDPFLRDQSPKFAATHQPPKQYERLTLSRRNQTKNRSPITMTAWRRRNILEKTYNTRQAKTASLSQRTNSQPHNPYHLDVGKNNFDFKQSYMANVLNIYNK